MFKQIIFAIWFLCQNLAVYSAEQVQQQLCYGDLVKIKHIASNQFLTSSLQSYASGTFDQRAGKDSRFKDLFLSATAGIASLWIIKGPHAQDLRWNCTLGEKVQPEATIRLENFLNHYNLTCINDAALPAVVQKLKLPIGIGTSQDEVKLNACTQEGAPITANKEKPQSTEHYCRIKFFSSPGGNLELTLSNTKNLTLLTLEEKDPQLYNAVWQMEVIETKFASKLNDDLQNNARKMQENKNFAEIGGTELSSIALWQNEATKKYTVAGVSNSDFYAYLANNVDGSAITQKINERFAQISLVEDQAILGITEEQTIKRATQKELVLSDWQEIPGKADLVISNNKIAYRLENVGGKLFASAKLEPTIEWQPEPILEKVVSADTGKDGTLWWIDAVGKVFKQHEKERVAIFDYSSDIDPKFVKISAAGDFKNNYIVLLRSDGKIFVSQNTGELFDIGIDFARDVAVSGFGTIMLTLQKIELPRGPVFKTEFADLQHARTGSAIAYNQKFDHVQDFASYYHYNFELVKNDAAALAGLIVALKSALDTLNQEWLHEAALNVFLKTKILPINGEKLNTQARQNLDAIKKMLTGSPKDPELEQAETTIAELTSQTKKDADSLESLSKEKADLEQTIRTLHGIIESADKHISELEQENATLKKSIAEKTSSEETAAEQSATPVEQPKDLDGAKKNDVQEQIDISKPDKK